jgi:hypothetical protein
VKLTRYARGDAAISGFPPRKVFSRCCFATFHCSVLLSSTRPERRRDPLRRRALETVRAFSQEIRHVALLRASVPVMRIRACSVRQEQSSPGQAASPGRSCPPTRARRHYGYRSWARDGPEQKEAAFRILPTLTAKNCEEFGRSHCWSWTEAVQRYRLADPGAKAAAWRRDHFTRAARGAQPGRPANLCRQSGRMTCHRAGALAARGFVQF